MSEILNISEAASHVGLPGGDQIVLFDRLGKEGELTKHEIARNVYRVDVQGHVKWQVRTQFDDDGDPFTQLRFENSLTAYRWDGATYRVDLDSGEAVPILFER